MQGLGPCVPIQLQLYPRALATQRSRGGKGGGGGIYLVVVQPRRLYTPETHLCLLSNGKRWTTFLASLIVHSNVPLPHKQRACLFVFSEGLFVMQSLMSSGLGLSTQYKPHDLLIARDAPPPPPLASLKITYSWCISTTHAYMTDYPSTDEFVINAALMWRLA